MEVPQSPKQSSNPFIHHPYVVGAVFLVISTVASFFIGGLHTKVNAAVHDIGTIKVTMDRFTGYIEKDLKDGQSVQVGINNLDISGNGIVVFQDNQYGLTEGDTVYLTNPVDDRYETKIKCVVQRTPKRNGDNSQASMFITLESARLLSLIPVTKAGKSRRLSVYPLKMTRKQRPVTAQQDK